MKRILTGLIGATTGGVLAGILLGVTEVFTLAIFGSGWSGFSTLFWAVAAYGLLGLLAGIGLGLVGSLLLKRWFAPTANWWMLLGGAAIYSGAGLIVIRFRVIRDLFQERLPLLSLDGLIVHALLLLSFGGILVAAWFIGRRWLKSMPAPSLATTAPAAVVDDPSRRTFLKATLATGLLALPAAAVASHLVGQSTPAFATINLSSRLRDQLRSKPNIIFIVADTLRADHLGVSGYSKAITPYLDDLAGHSIHFTTAFSQAAWTKPSMATILTSRYPSSHTAIYKSSALPTDVMTLPEVLSSQGYVTGGFANNVNIAPFFNFQQGFTDYEFLAPDYLLGASETTSQLTVYQVARQVNERFINPGVNVHNFYQPAEVVNERAINWLKARQDDRFFLFLHYMDPHDPYFEHPFNNHGIARVSTPNPASNLAPEMVRLYDQEIAYLDQQLGELFDWLKKQGLYDETMLIFTADHGEEFYEHGGWWHGLTLYDEQIHVPLFIKTPGQTTGTVDTDLARSMDIAPTILRLAGFDVPETMQGVDLLAESEKRTKFVFAEEDHQGNVLRAGRSSEWKFIQANANNPRGLPLRSFFHIAADPAEARNLIDAEPDKVAMASERVEKVAKWAKSQAVSAAEVELDQARKDAIEKSGYGK